MILVNICPYCNSENMIKEYQCGSCYKCFLEPEIKKLFTEEEVKEAIQKINPVTQDEFARGCLHTKNRLLKEFGLND